MVMNRAGADGLGGGAGRTLLVAEDWCEFADHVVELLTDARHTPALESEARACADRLFSPEASFSKLAAVLATARTVA